MSRFSARLILSASLMAALPAPARAAFTVCNRTQHPASVALGYYNGKDWGSAGWWTVAAGGCAEVLKDALNARYYYVYAEHHDVGGSWDGNRSFCVSPSTFTISGRADCAAHGYGIKHFFQVDTGNSLDWTQNLAD